MGVIVDGVGVDDVEFDEFGDGLGGGGYPKNVEMTEPEDPIETYSSLSLMTWSVQVMSVLYDVGGGVMLSVFLMLLVFLVWVVEVE